jgi:hypothetical protein
MLGKAWRWSGGSGVKLEGSSACAHNGGAAAQQLGKNAVRAAGERLLLK